MAIRKGVNSCKLALHRCCDGVAGGDRILSPTIQKKSSFRQAFCMSASMLKYVYLNIHANLRTGGIMGVGETLRRVFCRSDAGKTAAAAALAEERAMFHGVGLPAPSDDIYALGGRTPRSCRW